MAAVKGVEVHIHAPLDAGAGGGEGEGGEVHRQRVDGDARGERGKAESALLGKCRAAHYRLDAWSAVEDRVYGQRQMAEGEVVVVEPLDGVYGTVVIAHATVVEAEAAHAVEPLVQVQIALTRLESGNLCPYAQGVAGHVQGKRRAVDVELLHGNLPHIGRRCGVGRHGVAQLDVEQGAVEQGAVYPHVALAEVYAVGSQGESVYASAHPRLVYQGAGVEQHLLERQFIYIDHTREQRPELHVDHGAMDVGYGVGGVGRVVGLYDVYALGFEVDGECQLHMVDADVHARSLGGVGRDLAHRPVLYGWQVEQYGDEQQQCQQRGDGYPRRAQHPPCVVFQCICVSHTSCLLKFCESSRRSGFFRIDRQPIKLQN